VRWSARSVEIRAPHGDVAFACHDVEAPLTWSDLAVATVARRYLGRYDAGALERSVRTLIERQGARGGARARAGQGGLPAADASRSLAFQQANHAVRVTDKFMRAVLEDGRWELRAVTTGAVVETLPARRLLHACADAAWQCGDPGQQFASTIDAWHTCPRTGPVTASNPCGEFLHVDDSACTLATLNLLGYLATDGRFDARGFSRAVELLVVTQDARVGLDFHRACRRARALRPPVALLAPPLARRAAGRRRRGSPPRRGTSAANTSSCLVRSSATGSRAPARRRGRRSSAP